MGKIIDGIAWQRLRLKTNTFDVIFEYTSWNELEENASGNPEEEKS